MYCCSLLRDGLMEDILGGLVDNVDREHEQVGTVQLLMGNLVVVQLLMSNLVVVQLRKKVHFVDRIDIH